MIQLCEHTYHHLQCFPGLTNKYGNEIFFCPMAKPFDLSILFLESVDVGHKKEKLSHEDSGQQNTY
jgi:hypothetical protein